MLSRQVGYRRLIGGRPPSALWRRACIMTCRSRHPWSRPYRPSAPALSGRSSTVRVRDDLVWRRRPPCRLVPRRVGVADQGRVVPPDERAVQRRADARIGLCASDDEPPDFEARQHGLEGGVLEGVAVALIDERLGVARSQFGDDPPVLAPPRKPPVGVLDPDNGDPFPPRLLDKAADVRDDRVALVGLRHDAVLHVDDEKCGIRPTECGHVSPCSRRAPVSAHNRPIHRQREMDFPSPQCHFEQTDNAAPEPSMSAVRVRSPAAEEGTAQ